MTQFGGLGGASFAEAKLAMLDTDEWVTDHTSGISDSFLVKVAANKYAVVYSSSGVKITVFTVDSDGKIDSISRSQSLSGLTSGTIYHACYLEDDKILINHGSRVAVVSVSTLTATAGTEQSVTDQGLLVALSSTSVIIMDVAGNFRVLTISGTGVTVGSTFTVTSYVTDGDIYRSRAIAYSATEVVLVGGSDGTATTGFAIHFTFDTGTPSGTQNSKITLGGTAAVWADIAMLSTTEFVGITKNGLRVFTRSGTTLTAQDSEYTDVSVPEYPSITAVASSRVAVFDSDENSQMKEVNINSNVPSAFREMGVDLRFNTSDARLEFTDNGYIILTTRRGNSTNEFHHHIQVFQP